jgi:hypothetical protein
MFLQILVWISLPNAARGFGLSRRSALANSAAAAVVAGGWISPTTSNAEEGLFQSYQVIPDAAETLNPTLLAVQVRVCNGRMNWDVGRYITHVLLATSKCFTEE